MDPAYQTSTSFGSRPDTREVDAQRTLMQLSDNFANMPQIKNLVDNNTELLKEMRMPNAKKRLKAIVELKKIIQKKLATVTQ